MYTCILCTFTEPKALEFNQLHLGTQEDDNRHRERRVPSISYSTFISESRINSTCKPALDDKPISFNEGAYSHGKSKAVSPLSCIPTYTNTLPNTDELNRPLSAGVHPPELVSQSNAHFSMYDTPKKVASQSLDATPVWRSFTDLQLDSGNKMKPIAVPCIIPSHQSLTSPVNRPATHDVENKSVISHNSAVSIENETTYDIPRKSLKATPLCERDNHPQMPKYDPVAFGTASNECDSRDDLSLSLTLAPAVTCTGERTKPLSEMIKSHPLLKRQHVDHNSLSYPNTQLQCTCKCGNSSPSPCSSCKVAHVAPLKNDPTSLLDNTHQQGCLSTTFLESSTPIKQSDVTCTSYQRQTTEYSHVISASMNRAQTLIARNIQELKQLDCEQVSLFYVYPMARMGYMHSLNDTQLPAYVHACRNHCTKLILKFF